MKHIAIYLRVSTDKQTTASQTAALEAWAANQTLPVKYYRDSFSGRTMNRPGWSKLNRQIELGNVQQLVCWRLDRLGRTARQLTALFEELIERKVNLVSIKDGLDLSTAAGRLMANVLASVAQFEREVIAERILAGQAAAKAAGKTWGGRKLGSRISVTDEQIAVVRRLASEGQSKVSMAKATGLSRPTIYSILSTQS